MKQFYKIIFLFILISNGCILSAKSIDLKKTIKIGVTDNVVNNLALSTATISGTTTVCQNATSPQITFTGSGGTAPYTFTYTVTGVAGNQTIATTSGNSVTVSAPTGAAGTFTYNLISVHDAANPNPEQSSSGVAIVTVTALPVVDFTFTNDNSCSGTAIQFSSSVTGTATYTYAWDFGDGTTSTQQNPSHSFTSLGCNTATFNVTLTVTAGGCAVPKTKTITVKQKPDINFNDINNQFEPFNNCGNASTNSVYSINVGNSSVSTCIASFSINWGDGNTQNNINFPISHTYIAVGAYSMTITANGNNGCVNSKTYIIKNVSNPLGGLNSPGSTQNLCTPTSNLQFSISNWGSNSLDTTYKIDYSDGSPITILTQNQLNSSIYYNPGTPANSANYPIPHIYSSSSCPATSFEVKLDVTNACGTTPFTLGNISVLTKPAANFTAPINSCINNTVLFTNTTVSGYGQNCTQGSIFTWNFGDGSPIVTTAISAPQNINHTYINTGTYTVTLTAQNGCGTTTKTQQICIEAPLNPQFTLNTISGCTPQTITATNTTVTTNSCTTPTYVWNVTYVPAYCGTNITAIPNQTTTNASYNFTESGTYTIKLAATNSCSPPQVTSQIVTIKKPPTVSINPIANVCQTGNSTSINPTATVPTCANATYAWSFPGGTPATSTLAVPGIISYTTAGNHTVSLSVTNECGTTIATDKTFTINPSPTITGDLFSCVGFTSQLLGSATAATSSPWTSSNATVATVSSTGLVTGVSGGNTTITYTNSNNCTTTALFTVNSAPTITPLVSSTICIGGTPTVLSVTVTGATGTPTYQWYSNGTNNTTSGTTISGEINATYAPPSITAGTLYYYCVITLPTGGCSNIKTNVATVTIMPNATITTQPKPTQNLCVGVTIPTALSISYSGGTGTVSHQWYSNTINSNSGGSLITGATSATYTPPTFTIPGNYYYYATVSLNGNGCLPATSNVAEVIVFADPTISTQPTASQILCQNATPLNLDITASGGNGTFSYQWYSNSTNTNTGGILITGATGNSYTPPTSAVGTKYYYCSVSQNSTTGCSVNSATAAIIVISTPSITQPASSTVCQGGNPTTLSITVSGATGTPQYQWYSNSANNTTTGATISGETNSTYTPSASTLGTMYYYCIITLPSGGCSSITSNTATVTINAGATISTQPTPTQSICVGTTISTPLSLAFSGGTGTSNYQWFSNTTNTNTGGTIISGATNANYTPSVFTTSGNYYYYTVVTLSGNGCGPITSDIAEIVIVADPVVTSQPLTSQTICQNVVPTSLSLTATGGISAAYSYQWFSNTSNNTTSGTPISEATSDSYLPTTGTTGTTFYYCEIKQTNGSGCNVSSATATVVVNLSPAIVSQPVSSTICIGQTPTILSVSYINGVGTPTYQWYSNSANSIVGSTAISTAVNATYSPPNSTVGTLYYYCIITLSTGGCSSLTSTIAAVTINPYPVISNKTSLICSDNSFTITPVTLGGDFVPLGTTYSWTNPNISPAGSITGASAQSNPQTEISQTLINTTTSPATVTYTVTPLSGVCTATNFTIVVTVNPAISPNITSTDSTCFGVNNGAIQTNITGGIPFSSGAPYTISWTSPNGFTSSQPSISSLAPGDYNLSIIDAGGCPINETYTITEPQDITITNDLEKDITCFNAANGEIQITITGGILNYKIAWTKNGLPYAITEDLSSLSPGTYAVTVSDANNCGPKTASFTITEPPILALSLGNQTNILCFGQPSGAVTINVAGGTYPYTYAWTGPNGFTNFNQNLTGTFAGTYNLLVTDNSGCTKNLAVLLTQTPEINIAVTTTPIICYGNNNASINIVVSGGLAPYQILWNNLGSGTFQDNLSAGNYLITITDANNCIKTLNVNIPEAPIFTINPVVKNISCFGTNDGSINLNLAGGIAPLKLVWSDGSISGLTRNNLSPGSYTVTIVDSKPCTITRTFIILEPQLLVLSANVINAFDCDNANSGVINLLVAGGSAPFTYAWSNGATTEDLVSIPAGNYLVTVTDANGCSKQAQYSVNRPPPIVTGVVTKTEFDCETKYVKQTFVAQVSGGVPPYQLVWSSGTVSGVNNEMMNTNQNGTAILYVTDALGCKANYTFNVDVPTLGTPSFNATSYSYLTYGTYSINDPLQFTNTGTGDFVSVAWDFGDGTFSTELNPVHTFINPKEYVVTQTVTYPFGCIYVQKITFNVEKGYLFVVPTAFTPNNDSINDTFRPVTKALKNVRLDIYDTWGSLIYSETGDTLKGWDGKIKGQNAENGNYYCKVSAETFYGTIVNENHPFVLIK
ncbi:PKD domain-containing protein [Flavobacterium sp. XS2P24]|uniref:PKD domain-containing protein n=1 Tax=Flavobacterium sp. XS2P24 TaxID=3041249 RepID=UPI0024A9F4B3|nr:PKD domain-containing protein [Flavobacterium sp. XS2P24]MDI6050670.1 PKD domain-containing protein [Flavobacterium sp. XS2P24]